MADGTAAPLFKSEPPPETNDGPVTVVVGTTFDEIVMDRTKDVILEARQSRGRVFFPLRFMSPRSELMSNTLPMFFGAGLRAVVRALPAAGARLHQAGAVAHSITVIP